MDQNLEPNAYSFNQSGNKLCFTPNSYNICFIEIIKTETESNLNDTHICDGLIKIDYLFLFCFYKLFYPTKKRNTKFNEFVSIDTVITKY